MAYSDYIGAERGGRGGGGHRGGGGERGERGERGSSWGGWGGWGGGWGGGWAGWPYSYGGYGYGGYPMLNLPAGQVFDPGYGYVILGADPATGAPIVGPAPGPGAPPLPAPPMPAPPMAPPMPMGPPPDAFPFPARAAVVNAPMPTQANRDILPMSTGVPILPTQSAQITGRPQVLVFKIGRFVISNAGTAGGAADWIVNDIKIGNRSQFVQSGDVPGDLFATNAIDTFVRFEAAQTAMDVVVVVTYIGLNESGAPFFGAMVGTAAV